MVAKFQQNQKRARSWKSIIFSVGLGLLFVAIILFLGITNWRISQRREKLNSQIELLQKEIQGLEQKNQKLKSEMAQAGTKDYLEKVAREQLGYKAPGEEVVVVSREENKQQEEAVKQSRKFWDPRAWWDWLKSKF